MYRRETGIVAVLAAVLLLMGTTAAVLPATGATATTVSLDGALYQNEPGSGEYLVKAKLNNTGSEARTVTVNWTIGGTQIAEKTVTVNAGEDTYYSKALNWTQLEPHAGLDGTFVAHLEGTAQSHEFAYESIPYEPSTTESPGETTTTESSVETPIGSTGAILPASGVPLWAQIGAIAVIVLLLLSILT
ncbi:hypothetical protein HLRTI_001516 [Halorhabdus tiamatea SARL4B]|uniref:Uncharacterized protein n=1 Tax=Halorhabdus tiamatea SARL4B TaxID=1033806 RepID=F7PFL8_9EURY|nr:hypothetical protein [Halorhabdus tiamatea]ERJ06437.1 hypothetical protein HLRTI_001516 [Halorhabdus tiamatea SARL4B]CCQ34323.1 hypothetical protein HTIA_2211 [Halorhabdus tiamatea SARL4B]